MGQAFEVHKYSIGKLTALITEASDSDNNEFQISKKSHLNYFDGYFTDLHAQSILVEHNYTDRYYTEDFSEYYVRCFQDYRKTCTRLHFFNEEFKKNDFRTLLEGGHSICTPSTLQNSYLGFVVVKPLPQTVIGRTCLRVYPHNGSRHYPITRSYKVNLYGIRLEAVETLAFQEQDSVVAACATSALWSVLHGTGILFHHQIPSPSQLTKLATKDLPVSTRTFPNSGLSTEAMARGIKSVSLEPYLESTIDLYWLKCTLYAYIKAKIPMILGESLYCTESNPAELVGKHAVAITGYNLGLEHPELPTDSVFGELYLTASKINKIYVHDDQVGPFSKMLFDGKNLSIPHPNDPDQILDTTESLEAGWTNTDGDKVYRAVPELLLIPLYLKIRIPFSAIFSIVAEFAKAINLVTDGCLNNLEWDIYLTESNEAKEAFLQSSLEGEYRTSLLLAPMPKYIWRVVALDESTQIIEFLFDATDINQGNFFLRAVEYHDGYADLFRSLAQSANFRAASNESSARHIVQWFADQHLMTKTT